MIVAAVCAVLGAAGAAYFLLTIWAANRFQRERSFAVTTNKYTPPVSILKSLNGLDPHMYAAFHSHCVLGYPEYEVLFGVNDLGDPAVALVEKLRREFPSLGLKLVHCPEVLGLNGKVSTLAQMLPEARYEHIIINDSDILVPRDYLLRVMAPFAQPEVGMVTALYRGLAGRSLGSRLEALGLSTDFTAGVLMARAMEDGLRFSLGATMAITKKVINQIGGLASLADYLGDDYELGARAAAAGHKIALADVVVETAIPEHSLGGFWTHQMRWARNIKDRRPGQYFGLIVTFGLPWAVIAVLLNPLSWWTWLALILAASARFSSPLVIGRGVLKDRQVTRDLWLLPLRDFLGLAIWIGSYFGNTVEWRGLRFRVRNGKLKRL